MTGTAQMILTALSLPGVGRKTVFAAASESKGESERFWQNICARKKSTSREMEVARSQAESQLDKASQMSIFVCTWLDDEYPRRMRDVDDPPACLFIKGKREVLEEPECIAIIGTREPSTFGQKSARSSAKFLAERGAVIVSGLAKGCDALAHLGALDASGKTVAVLAHGLDRVYPAENRGLASDIVEQGGALVSEYPIGQPPTKSSFVERDRIQSALADAVLVIEAGATSGTMHAARAAVKQNRVLAAVQHPKAFHDLQAIAGNSQILSAMQGVALQDRAELLQFSDALRAVSMELLKRLGPSEFDWRDLRNHLFHSPSVQFRAEMIESVRSAMLNFALPKGHVRAMQDAAEALVAPTQGIACEAAATVLKQMGSESLSVMQKFGEALAASHGDLAKKMFAPAVEQVSLTSAQQAEVDDAHQGVLFDVPKDSKAPIRKPASGKSVSRSPATGKFESSPKSSKGRSKKK